MSQTCAAPDRIHREIREKYAGIAVHGPGRFAYPTGRAGAEQLGYNMAIVDALPPRAVALFCGVGNPHVLGEIQPGLRILDIGCGGGFDLLYAFRKSGGGVTVAGVDMTPEMARIAAENLAAAGIAGARVECAAAMAMPFADAAFDKVISNGALNLATDKPAVWREIFRVLRPGGRVQIADIMLDESITERQRRNLKSWSD